MKKIQFFKLNKELLKIDFIKEKITVNKAIIIINPNNNSNIMVFGFVCLPKSKQ